MTSRSGRSVDVALAALGALSAAGYAVAVFALRGASQRRDVLEFLALFGGLFVLYFVAIALAGHGRSRRTLVVILAGAALFRVLLLGAGLPPETFSRDLAKDVAGDEGAYRTFLLYDNDVWRYLWDGHVASTGIDPYRYSPLELLEQSDEDEEPGAALLEEELWQDVHDNLSYQSYRTVYPPLAQLLFTLSTLAAPGSVFVLKLVLAAFDFGTCLLLAGLLRRLGGRPEHVLVYAWNPLALKEVAGSGHVDALMIFFVVLAVDRVVRGRSGTGLLALGLAILAKLSPLFLVFLFLKRTPWRAWLVLPLTVGLGYLPFVASLGRIAEAMTAFSGQWVFNPGLWALVKALAGAAGFEGRGVADATALVLTLGTVAWAGLRDDGSTERLISGAFAIFAVLLLAGATVMPWYLLWALPFAALGWGRLPSRAFLALTGLSLLSYLIYVDGVERAWWLWVEHGAFFLALLADVALRKRREGSGNRSPLEDGSG